MFKFGSEVDKRSIMVGGPWHFDIALIVLTEPVGIGDVKKQNFSHVSFFFLYKYTTFPLCVCQRRWH